MDLLCVSIFMSIFGDVTDEKEMSMRAKWLRKKYIGVWRCESSQVSRMMSMFPSTVVRYKARNRMKKTFCCSELMGIPRRRKLETVLWFSILMILLSLLGIRKMRKC